MGLLMANCCARVLDVPACPAVKFPSFLDNPELVTACNRIRNGELGRGLHVSMCAAVEQQCGYMDTRVSGGPSITASRPSLALLINAGSSTLAVLCMQGMRYGFLTTKPSS